MKTLFKLFLLMLLVSSFNYAQIDFPLQVGNVWQYSDFDYVSESTAVKDTVMANGLTYTKISGDLFGGFYRKEGTKVFTFSTIQGKEILEYDFSLHAGDTLDVIVENTDTTLITVPFTGTKTVLGLERNYMVFFRDHLPTTNDGAETIANGLGLVNYSGEGLFFGLSGAVIDGVRYGVIADVKNTDENIPADFKLFQNYPNPFNPSTVIQYSIPAVDAPSNAEGLQHVTLKIYDILGHEATTLVNENQPAGNYEVTFKGSGLSSGVYFYTLKADNFAATKKLMLVK